MLPIDANWLWRDIWTVHGLWNNLGITFQNNFTDTDHWHRKQKEHPPSKDLALVSRGPGRVGNFLLKAESTLLVLSRITTPTPAACMIAKVAPSELSLYQGALGGTQWTSFSASDWGILRLTLWNSSNSSLAFWIIAEAYCLALPCLASFRLNHILHTTIAISSSNSSPK